MTTPTVDPAALVWPSLDGIIAKVIAEQDAPPVPWEPARHDAHPDHPVVRGTPGTHYVCTAPGCNVRVCCDCGKAAPECWMGGLCNDCEHARHQRIRDREAHDEAALHRALSSRQDVAHTLLLANERAQLVARRAARGARVCSCPGVCSCRAIGDLAAAVLDGLAVDR